MDEIKPDAEATIATLAQACVDEMEAAFAPLAAWGVKHQATLKASAAWPTNLRMRADAILAIADGAFGS